MTRSDNYHQNKLHDSWLSESETTMKHRKRINLFYRVTTTGTIKQSRKSPNRTQYLRSHRGRKDVARARAAGLI